MTIKWTDEACAEAHRVWNGRCIANSPAGMRILLEAATDTQFAPETDAEKVKRYEAAMRDAISSAEDDRGIRAGIILRDALSYSKGA